MRRFVVFTLLTLLCLVNIARAQTTYAVVTLVDMDAMKLLSEEVVANQVGYDNWSGSISNSPVYDNSGAPLFMGAGTWGTGTGVKLAAPGASSSYYGPYVEVPIPTTGNLNDSIYLSDIKLAGYSGASGGNACPYIRVWMYNSCITDLAGVTNNIGATVGDYPFSDIAPALNTPWYTDFSGSPIFLTGPLRDVPFKTSDTECQKLRISIGRTNRGNSSPYKTTTASCTTSNSDTFTGNLYLRQISLTFAKL